MDATVNEEGWYFFEYEFSRAQMNQFLKEGNFLLLKEFAEFKEQGILAIFGPLAGRFYARRPRMGLNLFGAFLARAIISLLADTCFVMWSKNPHENFHDECYEWE